jgi:CHASE2 domain-containing sensor protein/predicted Ser/Thr protein kinase
MAVMPKQRPRIPTFTIGLVLTLAILVLYFTRFGFLESLELKTFDWRARFDLAQKAPPHVVIVSIDDESIAKMGRWPWPRSLIAQMLDLLSKSGARVIGADILFSEPEKNPGLKEIQTLKDIFVSRILKPRPTREKAKFLQYLKEAEADLDNDSKLISSVKRTGNVVLPMYFNTDSLFTLPVKSLPPFLEKNSLNNRAGGEEDVSSVVEAGGITAPIPGLVIGSAGIGHINRHVDVDGATRWEILVIKYGGRYFPSFSLRVAMRYLNVEKGGVRIVSGDGIDLGGFLIPTDGSMRSLIRFWGSDGCFPRYSFFDVLNGKIPPALFKDKAVLLGNTAQGIGDFVPTPLASNVPGVEIAANVIQNILTKRFLVRPKWAFGAEVGVILVLGGVISLLLPRLRAKWGVILMAVLLFALVVGASYLFLHNGIWIKLFYPSILLIGGYIGVTSGRFLVTEKDKELVEADGIETNKMLGLTFQGQGMLDLAFEKFRRCPVDGDMKDILYNLALDFERKRMINKAEAVYRRIIQKDEGFRDVKERVERLKKMGETIIFGERSGVGRDMDLTLMMESAAEAPVIGRYQVIRELGRGEMGVVYLGKDPKINRLVAIKTVRFGDAVDDEEVKPIKERFFKEAEAAGRLSHPNIVTVYDVGEDHDLSYIAMEYIEGKNLTMFCKGDSLMSIKVALKIVGTVAQALDYAHSQGVVHRDIKPGNIMLVRNGTIKITDFGIARIATSSRTRTGIIMGTPTYMSPEQLAGRRVDGRSDIFSLGIVLYELLTGEKPFKGESITTLVYQIANSPHPSPADYNPNIPEPCLKIIDKALMKEVEKRYQRGNELFGDLQEALRLVE